MAVSSIQILEKLVEFDTTSYKSNLDLIHYIRHLFSDLGIETQCVFDESGQKANLYATVGPPDIPGIMLSGHTDVVPVEGQPWTSDPFSLTFTDNQYVGRGTADMKGFIASALAAVPAMLEADLRTPIHFALSYDEEVGCLGVRRLLDMLATLSVKPMLAIIGEPTSMHPVIGHKGKTAFSVVIRGKPGHSAYTQDAVNAVEYAARLITLINDHHRKRAAQGPFDNGYRVPHTTLHVGTINGGTALNIVPIDCQFVFEIRNIPEDNPEPLINAIQAQATQLQNEMREIDTDVSITLTQQAAYPGLSTDPAHPAVAFVRELLIPCAPTESSIDAGKVSFGTEAGLFTESLGVPAVVCGPGDIAQAHKPDEFLAVSQLSLCDKMMAQLVKRCQQTLEF